MSIKKFLHIISSISLIFFASCSSLNEFTEQLSYLLGISDKGQLSKDTIASGLKEALKVGAQKAVEAVNKPGGYNLNPQIKIPLPKSIQTVADTLRKVGLSAQIDMLEAKVNAAAEEAAEQSIPIFMSAISNMTFQDVMSIYNGGPTAATDYFRSKTYESLENAYAPIVNAKLKEVGALKIYDSAMQKYSQIPFVPKPDFNPDKYVTEQALNGLFKILGEEEEKIRDNPAARTTELLKLVFGKGPA